MATIVTRAGKGSELTFGEVDANFTNLNADKREVANVTFTSDIEVNNLTVGRGSGNGLSTTALGYLALDANTTGLNNVGIGTRALLAVTAGNSNTAVGLQTLMACTTGENNTAMGTVAGADLTTGANNAMIGVNAGRFVTTGGGNICIGGMSAAGTYAPVFDVTTENNRIQIGATSVTNAYVQVAWTVVSDARDKTEISPVPLGLDFVSQLEPVAFRFRENRETDEPTGPVRYGFLAQDVLALEGGNPVIVDNEDPEKLRYTGEAMIPVLVKALQEALARIEALEAA